MSGFPGCATACDAGYCNANANTNGFTDCVKTKCSGVERTYALGAIENLCLPQVAPPGQGNLNSPTTTTRPPSTPTTRANTPTTRPSDPSPTPTAAPANTSSRTLSTSSNANSSSTSRTTSSSSVVPADQQVSSSSVVPAATGGSLTQDAPHSSSSGTNKTLIAALVPSLVLGLVLIAILAYFLRRRYARQPVSAPIESPPDPSIEGKVPPQDFDPYGPDVAQRLHPSVNALYYAAPQGAGVGQRVVDPFTTSTEMQQAQRGYPTGPIIHESTPSRVGSPQSLYPMSAFSAADKLPQSPASLQRSAPQSPIAVQNYPTYYPGSDISHTRISNASPLQPVRPRSQASLVPQTTSSARSASTSLPGYESAWGDNSSRNNAPIGSLLFANDSEKLQPINDLAEPKRDPVNLMKITKRFAPST